MKKINKYTIILANLILIFGINISITNAITDITTNGVTVTIINPDESNDITWEEAFNFYSDLIDEGIPESYKYININFIGIEKDSKLYTSLQKLVYYNFISNSKTYIKKDKNISGYEFYKIVEKIFNVKIVNSDNINILKNRIAVKKDFNIVQEIINNKNININSYYQVNKDIEYKREIFSDVYSTILNEHYDKDNISEEKIIDGAIEGLALGTEDKHTVYFPPTESKNFYESLNGEYEGIGSYVDMEKPGVVRILSPIKDSPSEKAGLKGGDIILKVDGKEVLEKNSLQEVVSWIKGPKGTKVTLTIKRLENIFDIEVNRETIIIKDVEYKKLDNNTYYIEIKSFGEEVSKNFLSALEDLSKEKNIDKVIIDLRSNGGGYLSEVSEMLSYFVAKGKNTAVVKYINGDQELKSKGYNLIDFNKYKIVILQNSGTASASEIMIGTIKDYYPNTIIIGEKSYGKGSVQTIKSYNDGSTFKYTIAKWFTGLNQIGIDGVGIIPDINIELDIEKYNNLQIDNQLDKAKEIK